jgi:hypothetical protein
MQTNKNIQTSLNRLDEIKFRIKPDGTAENADEQVVEYTEREYKGVRIVDDPATGNITLFIKTFPEQKTRRFLKKHGFEWLPARNLWQANRYTQANYYAEKAIDMMGGGETRN